MALEEKRCSSTNRRPGDLPSFKTPAMPQAGGRSGAGGGGKWYTGAKRGPEVLERIAYSHSVGIKTIEYTYLPADVRPSAGVECSSTLNDGPFVAGIENATAPVKQLMSTPAKGATFR